LHLTTFLDLTLDYSTNQNSYGLYSGLNQQSSQLQISKSFIEIHYQSYEIDFENTAGNFDVLLANIGVLTASSFFVTIAHVTKSNANFLFVLILGCVFLVNQIDELFSTLALSGAEEFGMVLFCLFTHLSHLIISLIFFSKFLLRTSDLLDDNFALFVAAY
jgi:hypothetical protein